MTKENKRKSQGYFDLNARKREFQVEDRGFFPESFKADPNQASKTSEARAATEKSQSEKSPRVGEAASRDMKKSLFDLDAKSHPH